MNRCQECSINEVKASGRMYCSISCSNKGNGRSRRAFEGPCKVEGCEKQGRCKNLCEMHYARLLRDGDPGEAGLRRTGPRTRTPQPCSLDQCNELRYAKTYCKVHYTKDKTLRQRFKIDLAEYLRIWETQGSKCVICSRAEGIFHVDHCHLTSKVRGILCHHCNTALGNFGDDITTMEKAIDYLKERRYEI